MELSQAGGCLAEVQDRGSVRCGVADALPGFNFLTPDGDHEGFDSDLCRVIAAAVLGDAGAVDFVDLATSDRFTALQSGEIDVPLRNITFTANRYGKEAADFVLPRCRCTGPTRGLSSVRVFVARPDTRERHLLASRNSPQVQRDAADHDNCTIPPH